MAFSATITKNGVEGDQKILWGSWTGSEGDTAGTFSTGGSLVTDAKFYTNITSGPTEPTHVGFSQTSGDVTVYNKQTVTAGTFMVKYK